MGLVQPNCRVRGGISGRGTGVGTTGRFLCSNARDRVRGKCTVLINLHLLVVVGKLAARLGLYTIFPLRLLTRGTTEYRVPCSNDGFPADFGTTSALPWSVFLAISRFRFRGGAIQ